MLSATRSGWTPAGTSRGLLQSLIRGQMRRARQFDGLLPAFLRVDGNRDFLDQLVPQFLSPGMLVYDVGGGKNPLIGLAQKKELGLQVTGVDIDAAELAGAPAACYDHTICADIAQLRGTEDADLVICQALLEHVPNVERALEAIASILKPGGRALIFVPSRNAVYARLNLILPESVKRGILYGTFPEMRHGQGFPAYYDRCTPARLQRIAQKHGLICDQRRLYFHSSYFSFCLPLYVAWRIWLLFFRALAGDEAAETFSLVLRKPAPEQHS